MRDYNMTYIPDLTERYPEGFGGVDMFAPRDPEYDFWRAVDEADRQEREYFKKRDKMIDEYREYLRNNKITDADAYVDEEYIDEFSQEYDSIVEQTMDELYDIIDDDRIRREDLRSRIYGYAMGLLIKANMPKKLARNVVKQAEEKFMDI